MDGYRRLLLAIFRSPKPLTKREQRNVVQSRAAARKIVERTYGKLPSKALVHHVNGDPLDNSRGNLLVCTHSYHSGLHWEMSRRYAQEHF